MGVFKDRLFMSVGQNIKKIREDNNLNQQQIAELINMHRSSYSKIESGQREISVDALNNVARYFGMPIDQIVNFDSAVPQEITVEDKTLMEQVKMIQELEPDEKGMVFKMVDTFLTKKIQRLFPEERSHPIKQQKPAPVKRRVSLYLHRSKLQTSTSRGFILNLRFSLQ